MLLVREWTIFQLAEPGGRVEQNVNVEAAEIPEMPEPKMAVDPALFRFAERDQIGRVELKIGMQMERPAVMHLQLLRAAANLADRMQSEVLLAYRGPMRGALSGHGMLAFRSVDQVFDDWHRA